MVGFGIYFGMAAYKSNVLYEKTLHTIAKNSDIESMAKFKVEELKEKLSLGFFKNETKNRLLELEKLKKESKTSSRKYFILYMILVGIVFISTLFHLYNSYLFLAIFSFISLIFGLINPVLMITIHKNIEYLGDVILSFESKGILDSIYKLYEKSELVLASVIFLFSVLLPLFKSAFIIFAVWFRDFVSKRKIITFFKYVGKYSMIDVFVIAILLVYLSSNSNDISDANIAQGLYFFLLYLFLSIFLYFKVERELSLS